MRGTHKSWLLSCPCGDGNFKVHLREATVTDIEELLTELPEKGNKSKIAVLKAELRRRQKVNKATV